LENELRTSKEHMYFAVEEKNRLDEQLSSMQSVVFTSDHQLRSIQVTSAYTDAVTVMTLCKLLYLLGK